MYSWAILPLRVDIGEPVLGRLLLRHTGVAGRVYSWAILPLWVDIGEPMLGGLLLPHVVITVHVFGWYLERGNWRDFVIHLPDDIGRLLQLIRSLVADFVSSRKLLPCRRDCTNHMSGRKLLPCGIILSNSLFGRHL